jgi:hypothetical protein
MQKGEEGLNKAYDNTFNRIGNQQQGYRDLAKRVLRWIACAKRPLTTGELGHALAAEPGTSSLDMRSLYTLKDMVSSCLGLVTVDQDSNIIRQNPSCALHILPKNISIAVVWKTSRTYKEISSPLAASPTSRSIRSLKAVT